ncbi:MAG: putative glycoside hydrolase [Anaerolineaceae bacterium]
MNKRITVKKIHSFLHFMVIVIVIIIAVGCSSQTAQWVDLDFNSNVEPGPTLYTTPLPPFKPISLVWFYHAPPDGVNPNTLTQNFDLFISTREMKAGRDQLRGMGSQATFLQYIVLNEILEPDDCDGKPFDSQAAFHPGDYCTIDRLHPDWFLLTLSGDRVKDKAPHKDARLMDQSNPGWRQFWIERMNERDFTGWDGIFLDNLEARPRYHEGDLMSFPDLASYQKANLEFMKMIYEDFHARNLRVYANILNVTSAEEWQLYMPYLDGAMIENFAVDWFSGDYLTVEQWELHMQSAISAQAAGKEVLLVARGNAEDISRQEFALASYFLVNNGKAYFRYTGDKYDELFWYENYLDKPGAPLGDMYYENGLWKRTFENGQVTVDPESHQARINFPQ